MLLRIWSICCCSAMLMIKIDAIDKQCECAIATPWINKPFKSKFDPNHPVWSRKVISSFK